MSTIDTKDETARLRAELAARDRVIHTLIRRVAGTQSNTPLALMTQNAALAKVVERKTAELAEHRAKLQTTLEELKQAQSELVQEQKLMAIGQLAAGIAHEINTPTQYVSDNNAFLKTAFEKLSKALTACAAVVRAARAGEVPSAELEAAEHAMRRGRIEYLMTEVPSAINQSLEGLARISSIVSAMKSFSHPSGGVREPLDLNEAIQTTIEVARNEWKYLAHMVTDLDADLPRVWGLRDELNQVVLNLIVNAAHAIGEATEGKGGGTITVATRLDGDWVEIRIGDTGTGIPEHVQPRIFEPFFTTKAVGKGTGQGLSIAYSVVVEKHGGTIRFETQPGSGTTFILRLPVGSDLQEKTS